MKSFFRSRAGYWTVVAVGALLALVTLVMAYLALPYFLFVERGSGYSVESIALFGFVIDCRALPCPSMALISMTTGLLASLCLCACFGAGRQKLKMNTEYFSFLDNVEHAKFRIKVTARNNALHWITEYASDVFVDLPKERGEIAKLVSEDLGMGIVSFDADKYFLDGSEDDQNFLDEWDGKAEAADRELFKAITDIWRSALHGHKLCYERYGSYRDLGHDFGVDCMLEAYASGTPLEFVIGSR